ncbi:MAG: cell division protein SepF [Ilumatobacteraceae bacterium]
MSFWKKTMDYLGLGPDDAYDDYEDQNEPEPAAAGGRGSRQSQGRARNAPPNRDWPAEPDEAAPRAAPSRPSFPSRDFESPVRRTGQPGLDDSGTVSRPVPKATASRGSAAGSSTEPATVRPRRFDQAQEVADKFKDGQSVILNLEATERDIARRLIDFASGVCYSLDGSMEKVATGVYLLKPAPIRVDRFDDYEG